MAKHKIVVCDHIHQKGLDLLAKEADIELLNASSVPKSELLPYCKMSISPSPEAPQMWIPLF